MNNKLKNVAVVTYTTSNYSDAWPAYFGQLNKHLGKIKSYVLSDFGSNKKYDFKEHVLIEHSDTESYYKQYTQGLSKIEENFVIYSQEDFFLYDQVDHNLLENYVNFMQNSNYDYIRLIRCGFNTSLDKRVVNDLFEVDMHSNDAFSMQATLWKKERLNELYMHVKSNKWLEGKHWNIGCIELGIKGLFAWNGEAKIGKYHYDSKVWPYCCTAINKGQWNLHEYPKQMNEIIKNYCIDVTKRGVRNSQK